MSFTINLYYTGINGNAKKFADEMESSGITALVRAECGNLKYDYFLALNDPETILLIDSWESQAALDAHHDSKMMQDLAILREKYDLHMHVESFIANNSESPDSNNKFIRL